MGKPTKEFDFEMAVGVTPSGTVRIECPKPSCGKVHVTGPVVVGDIRRVACGSRIKVDGLEAIESPGRLVTSGPTTPTQRPVAAASSTTAQGDVTTASVVGLVATTGPLAGKRRASKPGSGGEVGKSPAPEWLAPHLGELGTFNPLPAVDRCAVPNCQRDARLASLCMTHYQVARRKWDATFTRPNRAKTSNTNRNTNEGN